MNKEDVFPNDFLWGAATASYQVEGGIENCDWAKGARDGMVPLCGDACDHYKWFREDFDIAKALEHNTHRLSIEWARIEPEEGVFNEEAVEHYRDALTELRTRDVYPLVTLWHFTVPVWFVEKGGWENKQAVDYFVRYCSYVVDKLGDLCDNYATMNEPMVVSSIGYIRGAWPPFYKRAWVRYVKVFFRLIDAHNKTYEVLKEKYPEKNIGIVKHTVAYTAEGSFFNTVRAFVSNLAWTHIFMSRVHMHCDWIGVNFYHRKVYGDTRELDVTDFNWSIDPEGVYDALRILWHYKKPLYVAEAGCADAKDRFRADYIRGTVRGIERALREGVDVRGYCYWSLLDNYEWAEGFTKRFGLVEVDFDTQVRTVRPSALVYRDIIRSHKNAQGVE